MIGPVPCSRDSELGWAGREREATDNAAMTQTGASAPRHLFSCQREASDFRSEGSPGLRHPGISCNPNIGLSTLAGYTSFPCSHNC